MAATSPSDISSRERGRLQLLQRDLCRTPRGGMLMVRQMLTSSSGLARTLGPGLPLGLAEKFEGVGSSKCGSGPPEPHHLTIPPLRECLNPQAAASKPSHSTRKPHHQTHRSPNTTSQLLVASPHHAPNHSCSEPPGGARAGANSGAANGSFIARSTRSIESGSWIAASSRRAPPQRGHVNSCLTYKLWLKTISMRQLRKD